MSSMSHAAFTIAYDGPALADHTMDVRDLAPAMMAIGQLCDAANSVLHGDRSKIKVHVKATEPGSFAILLDIIQNGPSQLLGFLSSQEVSAAANLKSLLFGGGPLIGVPSLIWLIKALKGRKPEKVANLATGSVRITIGDTSIDVPLELLRLYQDISVRSAAQKVVEEPLKSEGIDSFRVMNGKAIDLEVSRSESSYYAKPVIPDDILLDDTRRSAFSIISLAFKEDNKWRLNDGTNPISVTIEDKIFLDKVDNNQVSFSKGDILLCDVRVVQKQTEQGLKTDYTVIRVVDHRSAARQLPLPLENPEARLPPSGS